MHVCQVTSRSANRVERFRATLCVTQGSLKTNRDPCITRTVSLAFQDAVCQEQVCRIQ